MTKYNRFLEQDKYLIEMEIQELKLEDVSDELRHAWGNYLIKRFKHIKQDGKMFSIIQGPISLGSAISLINSTTIHDIISNGDGQIRELQNVHIAELDKYDGFGATVKGAIRVTKAILIAEIHP